MHFKIWRRFKKYAVVIYMLFRSSARSLRRAAYDRREFRALRGAKAPGPPDFQKDESMIQYVIH